MERGRGKNAFYAEGEKVRDYKGLAARGEGGMASGGSCVVEEGEGERERGQEGGGSVGGCASAENGTGKPLSSSSADWG